MATTIANSAVTFGGLTGATVQGIQYYESGAIRVGSTGAASLTDTNKHLDTLSLILGFSGSSISVTRCGINIRSTGGSDFGTNSFTPDNCSISIIDSLVQSATRLIMRGTGDTAIIRNSVLSMPGYALYSPATILENSTFQNMTGGATGGLGIRATFTTPPSGCRIKDSGNGINLLGAFGGTLQGFSFSNLTYEYYVQGGASNNFTADLNADDITGSWTFFWEASTTTTGRVLRRNTYTLRLLDNLNANKPGVSVRIADNTNTVVYAGLTDASGLIPTQKLVRNIYTKSGSTASSATTNLSRLPYSIRRRIYGFNFIDDDAFTFAEAINRESKLELDVNITQADKATVMAYTGFTYDASLNLALTADRTNGQIYDRTIGELTNNLSLASGFATYSKLANRLVFSKNLTLGVALTAGGAIAFGGPTLDLTTTATQPRVVEVGGTSIVTVANGSTNLLSWSFASGATINLRSGATVATVTVAAGQSANITAGAGVTLVEPVSTVQITNIPNVANAIVGVRDLTTNAETFPTITGTTTSFPSNPARSYLVCIDAPGYQLQRVTLSGATPSFEATLENNRALYESGVNISANLLFDYATMAVTFVFAPGVVFNNANIYRTLEDYLATAAGVFFANPPRPVQVPGRNFLLFPYDDLNNMVNPVVVRPSPTNTGDPRITDVVVILEGATNPQTDIFDFSQAGGRTIFYQTDATVANVTGGGGTGGDITAIAGSAPAATALAAALTGTGQIRANITQVAGQSALAASSVDFGNLGTITDGIPRSNSATAQVVTAGTVTSGGFATTASDDGTYFAVSPTASGLDFYLEFAIGSQFPSSVTINGRYSAISIPNRACNVFAWNWLTSAWEQISDSNTRMNHTTSDTNYAYSLLGRHREGSGTGRVWIRFQSTDTTTSYSLLLDQVVLKSASASATAAEIAAAVYARLVIEAYRRDHGIVIDTVGGAAGTVVGDNGIAQSPSNNLVDAFAIATAMKAKQFFVAGGSSLTINQAYSGWAFLSQNGSSLWSANLNGQTLTGTVFLAARVSGTGLSTADRIRFEGCVFDAATLGNSIAQASVLGATSSITAVSGADISLRSCYTVNVSALPAINFASPATATRIRVQDHKGSVRVQNMNANSTLWFSADGQLVIEASCTAGQIFVESTAAVVNNGFATVVCLNALADVQAAIAAVASDTTDLVATLQTPGVFSAASLANAPDGGGDNTDMLNLLAEIQGTGFDPTRHSLVEIFETGTKRIRRRS